MRAFAFFLLVVVLLSLSCVTSLSIRTRARDGISHPHHHHHHHHHNLLELTAQQQQQQQEQATDDATHPHHHHHHHHHHNLMELTDQQQVTDDASHPHHHHHHHHHHHDGNLIQVADDATHPHHHHHHHHHHHDNLLQVADEATHPHHHHHHHHHDHNLAELEALVEATADASHPHHHHHHHHHHSLLQVAGPNQEKQQKWLNEVLADIKSCGGYIASNSTNPACAAKFARYTGFDHASLIKEWLKPKLPNVNGFTSSKGFVDAYLFAMGFSGLGRYDLDTQPNTKAFVYVPNKPGTPRRPVYGDLCFGPKSHFWVSLGPAGVIESGPGSRAAQWDKLESKAIQKDIKDVKWCLDVTALMDSRK